MKIDIKLNKKYDNLDQLYRTVDRILAERGVDNPRLGFVIYECIDEDDYEGPTMAPDIESPNPLFTGPIAFIYRGQAPVVLFHPTWADILVVANSFTDGDHFFLEGLSSMGVCEDKLLPSFYRGQNVSCIRVSLGS